MDANDVKKKFFDVSPPTATPGVPKVTPKKRQVIVSDNDTEQPLDVTLPVTDSEKEEQKEPKKVEVKREKIILPPKPDDVTEKPEEIEETETPVVPPPTEVETNTNITPEVTDEAIADEPLKESDAKDELGVDPLPTQEEPAEPVKPSEPEPEDVNTPVAATYNTIDSLPDDNQKNADAIKTDTQEPKIYDTTAYHIPIKETTHGHGAKSAFVFGAVFAVVLVGGLVYIVTLFAK